MSLIDPEIKDFYNKSNEELRLQSGLGPLEFERNKELISRYITVEKSTIADVGGGTGHYAAWLSNMGHSVTLIDPVQKHITTAKQRSNTSKRKFKAVIGEAQKLPFNNDSIDILVLHGPLYHLQKEKDRTEALKEAKRVLKTGGIILGFAISYTASTIAALSSGMFHKPEIFSMCMDELSTSEHFPPEKFPGILGPAYFHRPENLRKEFENVNLKIEGHFAVEGLAWLDKNFFENWFNPNKKSKLLKLIRTTESNTDTLALSPHMMVAARK
ncbi:MAG: SAM-dependent methyltransferase [Flavobacterium sp. MedPE-SWcel]|uniref:class I SAM-dependent methyltransferase n=1 Tax=uncultured Flavobacterium sp. TaxID=165435 RepID=UPI00091D7DF3|nr:class I SAM-dependent methyltransferase [uncultured Flavobacterium sp.]OIQ15800.1 MAG: SAM-dependent methyltransferase [Flavobacterium sp. MedPE-SWcel]